jgi:hypothetical protein
VALSMNSYLSSMTSRMSVLRVDHSFGFSRVSDRSDKQATVLNTSHPALFLLGAPYCTVLL